MKVKNFQPRNRELYYFFPGWSTIPFFNRLSKSVKRSLIFPSDHSPNRLIPQPEEKRNHGYALRALRKAGFLRKFFPLTKEEP
jgi:hypothetical protein